MTKTTINFWQFCRRGTKNSVSKEDFSYITTQLQATISFAAQYFDTKFLFSTRKMSSSDEAKDDEIEHIIPWGKSKAKQLLYEDIKNGDVPLYARDENNKPTMLLGEIFLMHEEYKEYDRSKFSGRLSSIRTIIRKKVNRAHDDKLALENYKKNHPPSIFSHRGYIQWQGSDAQRLLKEDMEEKLHETLEKKELWGSRREYYEYFPLDAFRDKVYQEERTAKYLHTLKVKGKQHKSS